MAKLDDIIKEMNKKTKEEVVTFGLPTYTYSKIPFTSPRMNYCTFGGLPVGKLIEFYGEEHGGKALVNGTPVLTDNGWVPIESLSVGDEVFGEDGKLHKVLGVYPQGLKECVELTLRDGCTVKCSSDHLWTVFTTSQSKHLYHRNCKPYTMSTSEIQDTIDKGYFLPDIAAMEFTPRNELLIDPYLLGLLLGDGCVLGGTPSFSNTEDDIISHMSELVSNYDCTLKFHKGSQCQYHIVENKKSNNHIINDIFRQYDLLGKYSFEKFIPEDYKYASIENRLKLVAGLINTDGSVDGNIDFTSTSDRLILDFWQVCMSLGIQCVYKLYARGGRVRIPNAYIPKELLNLLSAKHTTRHNNYVNAMCGRTHAYRRKIKEITKIGDMPCTCIKVDNPTSLFITKDFIPTHNTTTALDVVANYQQMEDARKVLYVDAENTLDIEWALKLGVDLSEDKFVCLKPTNHSAEEIFQFILDAIETGEVGLWVLDSIPMLASAQELGKTMEEKTYAGISGPLTVFVRKAEMLMQRHKCTGIGINQIRDDLSAMYAGAVKTPGGKAWKHGCSVRMQFSKGKYIDEKGNDLTLKAESPAGNYVVMSMTKNKCCPPTRRTGFYTLNYEYGIDYLKDLVEVAIKYDVIQKSGAWFSIVNPETGELLEKFQGIARVYEFLENDDNEDVLTSIENFIDDQIK